MKKLLIGDVTITSIIERDGPWRTPQEMFPAYDPIIGKRHLAELDPEVFDPASGKMVITYQTYIVRTPGHTVLIDTCTGEDKGYPPPMDFPKQPWLDGFAAAGLRFQDIDYVFCTHLHIDHCGWNTVLRDGRWVPTFPKAKYIFHKGEYAAWEESTKRGETRAGGGGNVFRYNCQPNLKPKSPPYRRATHKKLGDKGKMAVLAFSQARLRCAGPCQSRCRGT